MIPISGLNFLAFIFTTVSNLRYMKLESLTQETEASLCLKEMPPGLQCYPLFGL
jgi:hypothetical protein